MIKKVKIIFSPEAEEIYHYLHRKAFNSKMERMILRALLREIEFIKANYHYGEPIAKNLIPQGYQAKYGIMSTLQARQNSLTGRLKGCITLLGKEQRLCVISIL